EHYDEIRDALAQELGNHQGLKDLNAARRKARTERTGDPSDDIANLVNDLIKKDPGMAEFFGFGSRLITSTGPGLPPPFKGQKFPSYFRLEKEPKGGLVKQCPVNLTAKIVFETDAENEYFTRPADAGELIIEPTPDLVEASTLWNGKFAVRFRVPWDSKPGDKTKVRVKVTDVTKGATGPLSTEFELLATPAASRKTKPGRPRATGNPQTSNRTNQTPALELPNPVEVKKQDWQKYGFSNPFEALRIKRSPEAGLDFYLNVDNATLLTELSNKKNDPVQVKYWFKWGLTLAALGVLRKLVPEDKATENEETEDNGADLDVVCRACDGLARVIIPMFRVLAAGPPADK
ncbi:MAG: hypothetical protein JRJ19_15055, partial [Deltaproteobacteria bacterium]|nr:hypothetical protein [Deltaproteobacteria bacterium]